jgi:hypothetical protein
LPRHATGRCASPHSANGSLASSIAPSPPTPMPDHITYRREEGIMTEKKRTSSLPAARERMKVTGRSTPRR